MLLQRLATGSTGVKQVRYTRNCLLTTLRRVYEVDLHVRACAVYEKYVSSVKEFRRTLLLLNTCQYRMRVGSRDCVMSGWRKGAEFGRGFTVSLDFALLSAAAASAQMLGWPLPYYVVRMRIWLWCLPAVMVTVIAHAHAVLERRAGSLVFRISG